MDESVLASNIIRVVENQCESELRELNRGVGFLLGRPDLETTSNPLAPTTIVEAFTQALHGIGGDDRIKLTILKELNQTSLGDINAIYADPNRHLEGLKIPPEHRARRRSRDRKAGARAWRPRARRRQGRARWERRPEIDLMAMLQRLVGASMARRAPATQMPGGLPPGGSIRCRLWTAPGRLR